MSPRPQVCIVVPTIRESSITEFLRRWEPEFHDQRVVVVEDNPARSFALPGWVEHYCWSDIEDQLGERAWIIPRRSDCVRSFGFYLARQQPCDFVVTLDDDCYPEDGYVPSFLGAMAAALDTRWPSDRWWNTLGDAAPPPRGYPYEIREQTSATCVHHGLWSGIPDLDAKTQAAMPAFRTSPAAGSVRVPRGSYFPMCGMNLAFRPEVTPALYFLLMGSAVDGVRWPYDRFGDIWAGIFLKKIADHLGQAISSGAPSVHHSRASDVSVNLAKETPGYPVNELLWLRVDEVQLSATTFAACYRELAGQLSMDGEYWQTVRRAMLAWVDLFPGE